MIVQQKKLRLDELSVESFVTNHQAIFKGGSMTEGIIGSCETGVGTCHWDVCGYDTVDNNCTGDTLLTWCNQTHEATCNLGECNSADWNPICNLTAGVNHCTTQC